MRRRRTVDKWYQETNRTRRRKQMRPGVGDKHDQEMGPGVGDKKSQKRGKMRPKDGASGVRRQGQVEPEDGDKLDQKRPVEPGEKDK